MAHWAVMVPDERYAAERLFLHDSLELTGLDGPLPAIGDQVALVAGTAEPVVFALGRVLAVGAATTDADDPGADADDPDDPGAGRSATTLDIAYTHRLFDTPLPADDLAAGPGAHPIEADVFAVLADKAVSGAVRREWQVGLYLPIEAPTPAEAVRLFWTYVQRLGPRELPTYVHPRGDELAMQAFVLGEVANLDPEDDDED